MTATEPAVKPKPLTTAQAWEFLADECEDPEKCGCCGRPALLDRCVGLCSAISLMRHRGMISWKQEAAMLAALPKGKEFVEGVRGYIWPNTAEGMSQRAEFCRKMAAGG